MKKATIEITETDMVAVSTMHDLLTERYNNPFNADVFVEAMDLFKRMRDALLLGNSDKEDVLNKEKRHFFVGYVVEGSRMEKSFGRIVLNAEDISSLKALERRFSSTFEDKVRIISFSEISQDDYNILTSEK